ncbi:class I SAM-dependent methyltransferase [Roseomonas elaeocarpi]|uniref:Class I SAM-dependent methyltransferase n=1 Tax=Roseomonas elaeocarpi TaxID=907779 RepID=A0ABV6JZ53_9PROT
MSLVVPFEPDRFRSAAGHYRTGRQNYAPGLIARVEQLCGLRPGDAVLDLGSGPAPLGVAFAARGYDVTAVDPAPEMLRDAAEAAREAGVTIRLVEGSSYTLEPSLGRFALVAIGRAFHWMDRADTLRRLDAMVPPGGCVALFSASNPAVPANRWSDTYEALLRGADSGLSPRRLRDRADWLSNEAVLLDGPFPRIERVAVLERRQTPVEHFRDRALSMSSTSAARIGEAAAQRLGEEVLRAMAAFAEDGMVPEVVESRAVLAWREGEHEGAG